MRVLLVDTSSIALKRLERMFSEIAPAEINTAAAVRTAIESVSRHPPDLIITDWNLQDHTAAELLRVLKTRPNWKDIPVMILSSPLPETVAEQAKQLGVVSLLNKPLAMEKFQQELKQFLPAQTLTSTDAPASDTRDVRDEIRRIDKLITLPTVIQQVLEVANDAGSSAHELAGVIKNDQTLTARILKIVNSAYYGFYRKIGNLDQAIVILGFEEIKNLTLAACLMQTFEGEGDDLFNLKAFWTHALGSAYVAKAIIKVKPVMNPEDAFVHGLLHDIGKVAFNQYFGERFRKSVALAHEQKRPLHDVSNELWGIEHAEIGGIIAETWKLPKGLVNAITLHHTPVVAGRHEVGVHLAGLANFFCHRNNVGDSGNPVPDVPPKVTLEVFDLADTDLDEAFASLEIDLEAIRSLV